MVKICSTFTSCCFFLFGFKIFGGFFIYCYKYLFCTFVTFESLFAVYSTNVKLIHKKKNFSI